MQEVDFRSKLFSWLFQICVEVTPWHCCLLFKMKSYLHSSKIFIQFYKANQKRRNSQMWVELRLLAFGTQNVCTHKHPNTQHLETVECSSHLGAEPGVRGAHLPLSLQATLETWEIPASQRHFCLHRKGLGPDHTCRLQLVGCCPHLFRSSQGKCKSELLSMKPNSLWSTQPTNSLLLTFILSSVDNRQQPRPLKLPSVFLLFPSTKHTRLCPCAVMF